MERMDHRRLLEDNRVELIETIDIVHSHLWDYLRQYRVVDETAATSIRADNVSPQRQISALLDYVRRRPVDCYTRFRQALFKTNQSFIVKKILEPHEFAKELSIQTDIGGDDVCQWQEDSRHHVEDQTIIGKLKAEVRKLKSVCAEKDKVISTKEQTIRQQEQSLRESQITIKRREEDLLKSREEISVLGQRIAIQDQELVSLKSKMSELSLGSPPVPLASPVRELRKQILLAGCVSGLADQGAILAINPVYKSPFTEPTLLRLSSDGSQRTPGFPAEDVITAIIPQDDQVLLLERHGRISRCPLDDLSRPTHAWYVLDVEWLAGGAALSHDQLVIVDNSKGELSTFNLSNDPKKEKQVKVKGLKYPTSVACGCIDGSVMTVVTESGNLRVLIYNAEWQVQVTIGGGIFKSQLNAPLCCIILPYPSLSGNILISDSGNERVSEFTRQGSFVRHWLTSKDGIKYPGSMSFVFPHLWLICGRFVQRYKIFD